MCIDFNKMPGQKTKFSDSWLHSTDSNGDKVNKAAKVLVACLSNGKDQDLLLRNVFMKLFMEQPNLSSTNLPPQRRVLHF